jgi:hypothetical protein
LQLHRKARKRIWPHGTDETWSRRLVSTNQKKNFAPPVGRRLVVAAREAASLPAHALISDGIQFSVRSNCEAAPHLRLRAECRMAREPNVE